jgi:hypothetical protein
VKYDREHIQNNPFKWDMDENNPVNIRQNIFVGAGPPAHKDNVHGKNG